MDVLYDESIRAQNTQNESSLKEHLIRIILYKKI